MHSASSGCKQKFSCYSAIHEEVEIELTTLANRPAFPTLVYIRRPSLFMLVNQIHVSGHIGPKILSNQPECINI